MSASLRKRPKCCVAAKRRYVPLADVSNRSKEPLFDHLVGEREQLVRNLEPERLGGLEIDDQLELGRLQDGQVGRPRALENPAGIDADLAILVPITDSVAHQAAGCGELAILEDRGHRVPDRPCGELFDLGNEEDADLAILVPITDSVA